MCISYVKLNNKTLNRIAYRLPRISELLERISGATVFTKLDMLGGYYQIRMRAEDVPKTAFTTPYGNFEFRVMPMGLCGAPSTFQYMMDNTFREDFVFPDGTRVPYQHFLAIYLDDICIFSKSEDEHVVHVHAVLQRLREHSLYVKPTKCEWMQTTIEFLGHIASADGLSVHPEKAAALQSWPAPTTLHELRSLLGTFGFWRPYIPHFAMITTCLSQLLKKGVVWRWRDDVEQAALDALKSAINSAPVLMHPDMSKPFVVVSDASDFGIGASLEQESDTDGRRRPVAFFSHKLNNSERKYPVHERELLAIVLALRKWRHLLYGSDFTVVCKTDHRPLQHFLSQANLSPRQVRWQQSLSEFNLSVEYVPGASNNFADGLSRKPDLRLMLVGAAADIDPFMVRIKEGIRQDPQASKLLHKASSMPRGEVSTGYRVMHGVLFYVDDRGRHRIYVPAYQNLRSSLLYEFHDLPVAGHLGWKKSYHALAQNYYWPGMSEAVHKHVIACPTCQRGKPTIEPKPCYNLVPVLHV